jgi:hypothetical protein
MLEKAIDKLKLDLKPLEHQLKSSKQGMYITHDGKSTIVIYTSLSFKAYIPKKYDGWDVKVIEWDPKDDLQLDMDFPVNIEDF